MLPASLVVGAGVQVFVLFWLFATPALVPGLLPGEAPVRATLQPGVLLADAVPDTAALGLRLPDPAVRAALGLSNAAPLALSLRVGPLAAIHRLDEDISRLLLLPDGHAEVRRWVRSHPPTGAWMHLRLVGAAGTALDDDALAKALGSVQRVAFDAPLAERAVLFDAPPEAAGPVLKRLPTASGWWVRLWDTPVPTLLRVEVGTPTVVDLLQDLSLGEGGLLDAVEALPEIAGGGAPPPPPGAVRMSAARWGAFKEALVTVQRVQSRLATAGLDVDRPVIRTTLPARGTK